MRVAVVGGGPAGLSAAWSLTRAGALVTVFEREVWWGGRLRTDALEGARIDPAVQFIASYYTETLALAEGVGARGLLQPAAGRDAFWRGGRAHGLTYGSPTSMAASGALPMGLKLRLGAKYLPFLTTRASRLSPAEPATGVALDHDGETIADWGRRELGGDFVELFAYPLLAAYGNMTPEETSAGYYHALSSAGLEVKLYGVRGGVGALAAAVVSALVGAGGEARATAAVERVRIAGDGAELDVAGRTERFDGAVVALPAPGTLAVCADLPAPVRGWLGAVHMRPALSLGLVLRDAGGRGDWFGLSFPRSEPPGDELAAICVLGRKPGGLVGAGRQALVVYPAPERTERLLALDPGEVVAELMPAVERALPGTTAAVERARVYRFPEGSLQVEPGALRRIASFDDAALPDRLALAGEQYVAPHVEGAVRSGRRAAERLLRALR